MHELNPLQGLSTHWAFYIASLIKILNESCEAPSIRFSPSMRESCALRLTIRYLLMFVHRRDLGQSSVSRTLSSDRVWESNAASHLCILLIFEEKSLNFLIQKPSRFSHTGCGGRRRRKNARKCFGLCTRGSASVSEAH